MKITKDNKLPRFMNYPSSLKERRKWHERYLKRFEQLENQPEFIADCEHLREQLESSGFDNLAVNVGGGRLLDKYDLPYVLIDFIVSYAAGGVKDYKMIHPPVLVRVEERYEKDENEYYKALMMDMTYKVSKAELRDYLYEEWEDDLKFLVDQLPAAPVARYQPGADTRERIVEYTQQGMSLQKIQDKTGFDKAYISKIRSRMRDEGYDLESKDESLKS